MRSMVTRVGVVGAGGIGRHHLKVIAGLKNVSLTAVAEVNEHLGKRAAEELGIRWYENYLDMAEREKIDVATIALPHYLHSKASVELMRMGVNVLVEKPIAVSVKEADLMISQARKSDVKLGVIFQFRVRNTARALKQMLERGELGKLVRARLLYNVFRSEGYYLSAPWRGTWSGEGGGVLINQGIHYIDLFQWFLGDKPSKCYSLLGTVFHKIEVEDLVSAIIQFESGVQVIMQLSTIDVPEEACIDLRGELARASFTDSELTIYRSKESLKNWGASEPEKFMWAKPEHEVQKITLEDAADPHQIVIKEFVNAVEEDREPLVNGEEGRKSLELVNAIILSAKTGKQVNFPIDSQKYEMLLNSLRSRKSKMTQ